MRNKLKNLKFLKAKSWKLKAEEGVALYMSIIILAMVFAIGFGIAGIFLTEISIARDISQFTQAIYAADAGTERGLYIVRKTSDFSVCRGQEPNLCELEDGQFANNASYRVVVMDGGFQWCGAGYEKCIRSIGSLGDTNRALEVKF